MLLAWRLLGMCGRTPLPHTVPTHTRTSLLPPRKTLVKNTTASPPPDRANKIRLAQKKLMRIVHFFVFLCVCLTLAGQKYKSSAAHGILASLRLRSHTTWLLRAEGGKK